MNKEQELLAAALKLFVEFGFQGTPTSKIAKQAGVANGTLFHYFKTKEDLIVGLYNHIKDELNQYLSQTQNEKDSLKDKMKNLYTASLQWGLLHKPEFYFIQQFHFSPHLARVSPEDIERQTRLHLQLLREGVTDKIFKPFPEQLISSTLGGHVYGVYQYLLNTELTQQKQDEIIGQTFELLWDMLTK